MVDSLPNREGFLFASPGPPLQQTPPKLVDLHNHSISVDRVDAPLHKTRMAGTYSSYLFINLQTTQSTHSRANCTKGNLAIFLETDQVTQEARQA